MVSCSANLLLMLVTAPATGLPLRPVPVGQVTIDDGFWSPKLETWRTVTLPDILNKLEENGALTNFDRVRDGVPGEHGGPPWYDGLLYETIRGSADFIGQRPDPVLEGRIDAIIERVAAAAARDPGGYVNTYTQMVCPDQRWGMNGGDDNWQHDVYNAGAMVEAAVHYWRATGKTRLLEVATRLANTMCDTMGPPPRANVVPGHSIAEEAFVKLYLLFRDRPQLKAQMPFTIEEQRFLELAEFWIENRGHTEGRRAFGSYGQDHQPVLEQETIEGHAVRATLLCAGLTAAAGVNGREDYKAAAVRLWESMVRRRMYVTGGLGAVAGHEGFGPDYVLPNSGYLETCAAVGAAFFHHNLGLLTGDGECVDELERALYNGVLVGTSLAGDSYFYENPLERGPEVSRWAWHSCPCCPPMFVKAMGALPGYIYATGPNDLYVNLFIGSSAHGEVGGVDVTVTQETRYPWDGDVRITVHPARAAAFAVHVRIPRWSRGATLTVNGSAIPMGHVDHGYVRMERTWTPGDEVLLHLPMPPRKVRAHPQVEADRGRVALARGPLVYCLEGMDNGGSARRIALSPSSPVSARWRPDLLGGVMVLEGTGWVSNPADWPGLYAAEDQVPQGERQAVTAVPYYASANREATDMVVWMSDGL